MSRSPTTTYRNHTPMRSLVTRGLAGCLVVATLAVAPTASAVSTRSFELDSQDDFMTGSDLHGVAVDSQGRLRAGWNLGTVSLPSISTVLSALELADGSVLIGTGNNGKVMRLSGGKVDEYADTKEMGVTSMVTDGKVVYAATLKGKIWKLEGPGKASELVTIPDGDHILALAWDAKKHGFYAATGPNGKLFFVAPGSAPSLVFDSDETQLSAVTVLDDGTVYAGSTGKGLVFKITGPGRATIVLDPPGDEIKALAKAKDGGLYVLANEVGASSDAGRRPSVPGGGPGMPAPPVIGRPRAGKGALWKVEADGRAEELFARKDTHFISLAVDDAGAPYVGTAAEGRVFTVDDNHTSTLVADIDSRQVGALLLSGKTKVVVGSDPAVAHEIRGTGGDDATWTSRVLDTGRRSTFGRLFWRAEGAVELAARTGNSPTADATWSEWSPMLTAPAKPNVPPGRFIQVRARFSKGAGALLRSVEVPYTSDNVRAVVTSIDARSRGASSHSSNAPAPPPGPGGVSSGPPPAKPSGADVPPRASGVRLSWRVDNPDGDQLRYRVSFRFDGHTAWRDLTKPDDVLTRSELDWDTASLPEGTYRVRIEATDETSNPPDRVTRHALESGPVLVDNTPPVFRGLSVAGRRVKADIVDGLGPIVRVDFAVDGRTDWRPLLPKDGVFDEPTEEFDADLSSALSAGPHLIAVRAFDKAGNQVVRDVEMK